MSTHITEDNEHILIGAPGVSGFKGSVILYNTNSQVSQVPNPNLWKQSNDSYFGYAVSSGYFEGSHKKRILYVASAPQGNEQQGEVIQISYF